MYREKRILIYLVITYVLTGLTFSIAGYIYRYIIGKEEVFSPLIGVPLDIVGWPLSFYGDVVNFGFRPQEIAAGVVLIGCIIFFVVKERMQREDTRGSR